MVQIAKLSAPLQWGIVPRLRIFSLLDGCRADPLTWLAGPAGSGKTSLVASYLRSIGVPFTWYRVDDGDRDLATFFYFLSKTVPPDHSVKPLPLLTPEYLLDIPTFSHRFFERLFTSLLPESVLVLDDYHQASGDCPLHDVLCDAVAMLPPGLRIIVASRQPPPPKLIRFRDHERMTLIGWDDLRLTIEETKQILSDRRPGAMDRERVVEFHRAAGGWTAGLIMLIQGSAKAGAPHVENVRMTQEVFDYFATEVFEGMDPRLQDFLLKTALLPRFSPSMASDLTGYENAHGLLCRICREGHFTSEHHLFRSGVRVPPAVPFLPAVKGRMRRSRLSAC